jgi:hypothetical protein
LRALNMGIIRRANFSTPIDSQQWASPLNNSP